MGSIEVVGCLPVFTLHLVTVPGHRAESISAATPASTMLYDPCTSSSHCYKATRARGSLDLGGQSIRAPSTSLYNVLERFLETWIKREALHRSSRLQC